MKRGDKSILGIVIAFFAVIITTITTHVQKDDTFRHVDNLPKSNIHVVILSGHGSILNNEYQTAGKQSPTWPDSLKIYEGYSCKLLALELSKKLTYEHIDNTIINNYSSDLSLFNRVELINKLFKTDNRLLMVSIHHNAQPVGNADYVDFEGQKGFTTIAKGGASGIEVYTSPGLTESDNFADNYLMPQLKGYLTDISFRNNGKSKEAGFYVLSKTTCPAVLIEFNFMTTWRPDCLQIADPFYRNAFTSAICTAIIIYNESKNTTNDKDIAYNRNKRAA